MLECKEANADEKSRAFLQVFSSWPHASEPLLHLERRLASVQHQRASWFVGLLDGKVVSSLGAYPYQLYGPDGHRPARFFGAVFTDAAVRGRGYAAQLLRWTMQHYSQRGVLDFCLFSDIGTHYYEKLGFRPLPSWEWSFEVPAEAPPLDGPLSSLPLQPQTAPSLDCAYGIERSPADSEWIFKKQTRPLTLSSWRQHWLLSAREESTYLLLESSLPQDSQHWKLFRDLVSADACRLGCKWAQGWWTAAAAAPDPLQSEILPRDKEVLMWSPFRGSIDSWFEPIIRHGFRVFASEHI